MTADRSPDADETDPLVEARVEHALDLCRDLLPPEDLAPLRDTLELFFATHPIAAPLLDGLREREVKSGSGEQLRPGAEQLEEVARARPLRAGRKAR
jgi:hypothetical protein